MKKLNLVGLKFSRLTVLSELSERTTSGKVQFECQCDCGKIVKVIGSKLKNGWTKSCSCLQKEAVKERSVILNKTHGLSRTSIYTTYQSMIARCNNPKAESYTRYGGRGIKVCKRWMESFENFYQDMGDKPSKSHSIERISNEGDYELSNCKWATIFEQENNKSTNVVISYKGDLLTIAELSRLLNISYSKLWNRLKRRKELESSKSIFTYE